MADDYQEKSQFRLLGNRRFGPFFVTQFLGAFNDNLFKNALIIALALSATAAQGNLLINVAAGLFILPFFLFSAQAGQIAEKLEKSRLIRLVKLAEIAVMALGGFAFIAGSLPLLMVTLFLMGAQSALFGPVKYSILPQHLETEDLVGGNALVETGTFVAILLGTIAGGILGALDGAAYWVAGAVLVCAVLGWFCSHGIPEAVAGDRGIRIDPNPLRATFRVLKLARRNDTVFKSILGISWFWLLGAAYLTQIPNYTRLVLGGDEHVITLLLAVFSISVGTGSLLCEKMSGHRIEIGLVPFGAFGLTVFGVDLYLAAPYLWVAEIRGVAGFVADPSSWRVLFDLAMLGIFGGFYTVPLYASIQVRTPVDMRGQVIAANNILNALFMVAAALLALLALTVLDLSIPQLFILLAALNVGVSVYIFAQVPEFSMRFLVWVLTSVMYRIDKRDLDAIPDKGAVLLVCNHISYVDALIIAGAVRRPVRFVMDAHIFDIPVLNFIFRVAGTVPILPRRQSEEIYQNAFARVAEYLAAGEIVCIFPEGALTRDGEMQAFRAGVSRILKETPVAVVPMALRGLWGSVFSRAPRALKIDWRRLIRRRVELVGGAAVKPDAATPEQLQAIVAGLRGDWR
jgi:1-acyl-sn-glycerol-3-phosphate acyltransferase